MSNTMAKQGGSGSDKASPASTSPREAMLAVLQRQREAFLRELPVSAELRKDRLRRTVDLVVANKERLAKALCSDFGQRSATSTMLTDIMTTVRPLRHAIKHVEAWMKPESRPLDLPLRIFGARAHVEYQPKGVIGVIAPWNLPIMLIFTPLAQAFAAGNRAMVKPSEFTPCTSELVTELVQRHFDPAELAMFPGDQEVGRAFAGLPFDHLLFTGATAIGRHILHAAADNLVPTTLELGGKSPVIVGESADTRRTTQRVMMGKLMNAGQICLAPDYLLVPKGREEAVVQGLTQAVTAMYPTMLENEDYTSIINRRHRERLQSLVADAREHGAEVVEINPAKEDFTAAAVTKLPVYILRKVNERMRVTREEIFGPVLPVLTYEHIDEAIDYVNRGERPLGLYYFGDSRDEERRVLDRTVSGGVTVNDVLFHGAAEELPFGGIGASGMGAYHGREGFRTFSHAKGIYHQPRIDLSGLVGFRPPYGSKTRKTLKREVG